ncbi:hypothetical protein BDV25DRAFT_160146 [Aspergillus avenaceus]|uniref:DUF3752 domain-containing protein n=1 Tax=Aspergillus avenaceus TaxID=36643 RepID=A0A5N6TMQ2_ASPAV|nr:hypothetical protein BDV25DRAFT_160146 [Aspergillus avenaceus]
MDKMEKRKLEQPETGCCTDNLDTVGKRQKLVGPTLPSSTTIDKHNLATTGEDESSDDSDEDDDFGPSLPPPGSAIPEVDKGSRQYTDPMLSVDKNLAHENENHRDKWMLHPPESGTLGSRIDPTKLRNRKFQTGASATDLSSREIDRSWTETPEQKMKRLQDEVMGISAINPGINRANRASGVSQAVQKEVQRYNGTQREDSTTKAAGIHPRAMASGNNDTDDPSSRAFDREKDMALSSRISNLQRRQMLDKASDYSSRFEKGRFL